MGIFGKTGHRAALCIAGAVCAGALVAVAPAAAQDGTIYPLETPDEPNAIPLNTGGVEGQTQPETWFRQWGDPMARNISNATLTPYLPDPDKATGAAVIVAPGGGFLWLSMGNEGWEVGEALAERGVAAFVLKYRLRPTHEKLEDFAKWMEDRSVPLPGDNQPVDRANRPFPKDQVEDVEAAYAMIVENAEEWGVDTSRIGMIGFSAGAGATMATVLNSDIDLAFAGPIYGGLGAVEVPEDAPPLFVAIAADDFLFNGETGLVKSWYDAKKPVELHVYQNGGHGFGLGNPDRTSNTWFNSFMYWLEINKMLDPDKQLAP